MVVLVILGIKLRGSQPLSHISSAGFHFFLHKSYLEFINFIYLFKELTFEFFSVACFFLFKFVVVSGTGNGTLGHSSHIPSPSFFCILTGSELLSTLKLMRLALNPNRWDDSCAPLRLAIACFLFH